MTENTESKLSNIKEKLAHISETYDEALLLQKRVSTSWGLDKNSLQCMDDLQKRLASEIQDLDPERAANLRTMLHNLNINHHVCLIQVSNRTRALVFNEFLRRVAEVLKDYG